MRSGIESVWLLEVFIQPVHVLLEYRHDFLDAAFVCALVVNVEFSPCKERKSYSFRIFLVDNRLVCLKVVLPSDGTIFFLVFIEIVDVFACWVIAVGVNKKK